MLQTFYYSNTIFFMNVTQTNPDLVAVDIENPNVQSH